MRIGLKNKVWPCIWRCALGSNITSIYAKPTLYFYLFKSNEMWSSNSEGLLKWYAEQMHTQQIRFSFISMFWYLSFFFFFGSVRVYFYITIWFWSHDRAHLNLKIEMQAILECIYLLLHLTQQVHHDHSSFSISVSNSDSTTSTRHHQLIRYIAICQKKRS